MPRLTARWRGPERRSWSRLPEMDEGVLPDVVAGWQRAKWREGHAAETAGENTVMDQAALRHRGPSGSRQETLIGCPSGHHIGFDGPPQLRKIRQDAGYTAPHPGQDHVSMAIMVAHHVEVGLRREPGVYRDALLDGQDRVGVAHEKATNGTVIGHVEAPEQTTIE